MRKISDTAKIEKRKEQKNAWNKSNRYTVTARLSGLELEQWRELCRLTGKSSNEILVRLICRTMAEYGLPDVGRMYRYNKDYKPLPERPEPPQQIEGQINCLASDEWAEDEW